MMRIIDDDGAWSEKSEENKGDNVMAEKKESMTGRFLIEDDWYLIADENSWNIGKRIPHKGKGYMFTNMTYHSSPQQALEYYLHKRQSKACLEAGNGTLKDMVNILSEINESVLTTIRQAFSDVYGLKVEIKTDSDNGNR